ncbi:BspA family leucine-rich repeat surface protein [Levilactobacillus huananensis]|uniref:BspA family leucine-rich repeat surface protein n=1 Tax=Levilactobacillus huananensis TaxID=2486019 RepID=UPI000F7812E6|nr:BspA family leucine-rich repeat surface protein [Levilactobacillus huananensis]
MTKKLRMTSKQKLTTLAVLGAVAGMGLQVDTVHAATTVPVNDGENSGTGTSTTANDTTTKQATITTGTPKPVVSDTSTEKAKPEETTIKQTVTEPEKTKETPQVTPTVTTDESSVNEDPVTVKKTDTTGSETGQATASKNNLRLGAMSRANLLRADAAPTIKASGDNGTAHWVEDADGVVTITGGKLTDKMYFFDSATKLIFDGSLGKIVLPSFSNDFFQHWSNLTEIDGWENVDASNVTDMSHMFSQDVSLKSLDLSALDLSHVTNMSAMVSGGIVDETGNHPMGITSLKLGSSTSHVTDMSMMLMGDSSLTDVDVADWNVSSLQIADALLQGTAMSSLDLSDWQTPALNSMSGTFAHMPNLISVSAAGLQTGQVTAFNQLFENDSLLNDVDVSQWDVSSARFLGAMFHNDSSLTTLDLSHWRPQAIRRMNIMFEGDSALTSLDLTGFDTLSSGQGTAVVNEALQGTTGLHELVLGPNTSLGTEAQNAELPDIPVTDTYTGLWQAVGTGTVEKPNGVTYTSAQLNTSYDGATMADTYVWQQVPKTTTPTNPGTTPDNPGTTDPGTTPDTDGGSGATADGGENGGDTVTTDKNKTKKPATKDKPSRPTTMSDGDKMTTLSAGQGAAVTTNQPQKQSQKQSRNQSTMTVTDHQSGKATLPQTNEKKSSLWAAIGAVTLGILSFHWYKRQD